MRTEVGEGGGGEEEKGGNNGTLPQVFCVPAEPFPSSPDSASAECQCLRRW